MAKNAIRLTQQLTKFAEIGRKLLNLSNQEIQERATSAYRLLDKLWRLVEWDEWLVDVLVENETFTALIQDGNADLYIAAIIFDGDDVSLGERIRVTESYDIVPVGDDTERIRTNIRVFRGKDGTRHFVMRACTSVLNRVGEIDSSELFDEFKRRFDSGNYDTPFMTLRHLGETWSMGKTTAVFREGVVLVTAGDFYDTGLAEAAYESIERYPDYWGVSIGYGFEPDDPPPDIVHVTVRSGDIETDVPIPVYNRGTLGEQSLLAEHDAAAPFTSINNLEVIRSMPQSRKNRGLREDLLHLFPDQEGLIDDVVAGTSSVNDLVEQREIIRRDASTDVTNTDDDSNNTDDSDTDNTDTDSSDVVDDFEIDEDMLNSLSESLASNEGLIEAVASRLEVDDAEPDETIRGLVAELSIDVSQLREAVNGLIGQSDNRQSGHTRRVRMKGDSKRPRDLHERKNGRNDDVDDYEEIASELDAYLTGIADEL